MFLSLNASVGVATCECFHLISTDEVEVARNGVFEC